MMVRTDVLINPLEFMLSIIRIIKTTARNVKQSLIQAGIISAAYASAGKSYKFTS